LRSLIAANREDPNGKRCRGGFKFPIDALRPAEANRGELVTSGLLLADAEELPLRGGKKGSIDVAW